MLTITNCYFDGLRTSRIASCESRASQSTAIAPNDFFFAELFNVGAGRRATNWTEIEFSKSRFATMCLRREETRRRLFDIVENNIMAEKYQSVNGAWPEGTRDGRDLKPTPQEARAGARKLYRIAMGKSWTGPVKITSGRRYTYPRWGVFSVNPDQRGGGWHEIVHSISHYAARRLYGEAHGPRHAFIERELIKAVVNGGWLEGKLRKPEKPKVAADIKAIRRQRVLDRMEAWESKKKRAETALRKLRRQQAYYERQIAA